MPPNQKQIQRTARHSLLAPSENRVPRHGPQKPKSTLASCTDHSRGEGRKRGWQTVHVAVAWMSCRLRYKVGGLDKHAESFWLPSLKLLGISSMLPIFCRGSEFRVFLSVCLQPRDMVGRLSEFGKFGGPVALFGA